MRPCKLMGELTINMAAPTTIFQKTNLATCRIFIDFHDYFSYIRVVFVSAASRPFVPQEISSILQRAKVLRMFR